MASAVDSRLAYARLSAVATASRLPTATRDSNNSYTTSWDTTLYSPRPDVNWTALNMLWAERGYRTESFCSRPVRYRKPLDAQERADMLRRSRGFGKPDEAIMRDGYFLVDLTLAHLHSSVRRWNTP